MNGSKGAGKTLFPWLNVIGSDKEMEVWKKEVLCCFYDSEIESELEIYMISAENDERPSSVWIKITNTIGDGKSEATEFPVKAKFINELVAGIKKARLMINEQWKIKEALEENKETDDEY